MAVVTDQYHETYMTDALGPLPFCPGCGHERILKDLDSALTKMQIDPRKLVIVTDIGCIGLADRYFKANSFHGLHGRSLTYATGLKLANPELTVVVLMGDGGCGIGGAHLLSAARRNLDITLIIANNFNYGMTGGQHSVTTPIGGLTPTTPGGNVERAIDICAIGAGAGATWAYRGISYDKDLDERIIEGIKHPGFSILDIWELCTAYYMPRNEYNKKELYKLIETSGLNSGLIVQSERGEFGAMYRESAGNLPPAKDISALEPVFGHKLKEQTGVVIAGSAGEKIRSAASLFSRAGIMSNLHATQKDDYPITVMTGHSVSEINLSPVTIEYTAIDSPDYFVIVSEDGLKKTAALVASLGSTTHLIVDEGLQIPDTAATIERLPLVRSAKKAGQFTIGLIALGALIERSEIYPTEALRESVRRHQKPGIVETNLRAIDLGSELAAD